jgi:hypothetical protein
VEGFVECVLTKLLKEEETPHTSEEEVKKRLKALGYL